MNSIRKTILVVLMLMALMPSAKAAYTPFNTNSTGNIGIGSVTPGQKLDVQGTVRATNFVGSGAGLTGINAASDWTYTSSGNIGLSTTAAVGIGTTFIGGANGAGLTVMNGNVGIGTWIPTGGLVVMNGNVGIGTNAALTNSLTVNGNIQLAAAGTQISSSGTSLILQETGDVDGTSSLALENRFGLNGAVFTDPSQGLVDFAFVSSAGTTDQNNIRMENRSANFLNPNNTTGEFQLLTPNGGFPTAWFATGPNGTTFEPGNNVGIGTWNANTALEVVGNVGIGTLAPNGALDVGTGTICINHVCNSTWPAGGASNWTYTSSGNVGLSTTAAVGIGTSFIGGAGEAELAVMNGNVGIGTWLPADNFQIGKYKSSSSGFEIDSNGNVGMGTTITSNASLSIMNGNVGIGTWVPNGAFVVASGAGNVGIGTTVLVENFNTGGEAVISSAYRFYLGASDGNTNYTDFRTNPASGNAIISAQAASVFLNFDHGNAGEYLCNGSSSCNTYITSAGNVGINTLNYFNGGGVYINPPINKLEVGGAVAVGVSYATGTFTAPTNGLIVQGNVGIGTTIASNGGLLVMNGSVGIGTWVPQVPLEIYNTGNTILSGLRINNGSGSSIYYWEDVNQNMRLDAGGGSVHNIILNGAGPGNVGIGTTTPVGGLAVMNGNVGIGTWVPAYNFDLVNGTARERNVRRVNTITSSGVPAINTDTTDLFTITALAANITSMSSSLTGTPKNGDLLEIRILDNGTARTIVWGASFGSTMTSLPSTTVISTTLRVLLEYNSANSLWECIGVT